MNDAYLHLLINHIPILGSLFGLILLVFGLFKANKTLIQTALITFIISATITLPTDWTGEGAEEIVEELGVSHDIIHEHEEVAESAVLTMLILGLLSLVALILNLRHSAFKDILNVLVLVMALIVFYFMYQAGNTGGEIRHPEVREGFDG